MKPTSPAWIWILLALVVAGAGAIAFVNHPPPEELHRSSALIRPPSAVAGSVAEVQLFVTDLPELIVSDPVLVRVIEEVPELDVEDIREGFAATRRDSTSLVEVSFTHADGEVSRRVVEVSVRYVLDQASRRPFDEAGHLLETAETRLGEAETAMDLFLTTEGVYDPEAEYRAVIDEIHANQTQIAALTIEGIDEESIALLVARNEELLADKQRLGQVLSRYRSLAVELESARAAMEEARIVYDQAKFQYETENSVENLVVSRDVQVVYDDEDRLQGTALAGAVALGLGLITLIPLGAWLVRRGAIGRHRNEIDDVDSAEGDQMQIYLSDREPKRVYEHR